TPCCIPDGSLAQVSDAIGILREPGIQLLLIGLSPRPEVTTLNPIGGCKICFGGGAVHFGHERLPGSVGSRRKWSDRACKPCLRCCDTAPLVMPMRVAISLPE